MADSIPRRSSKQISPAAAAYARGEITLKECLRRALREAGLEDMKP